MADAVDLKSSGVCSMEKHFETLSRTDYYTLNMGHVDTSRSKDSVVVRETAHDATKRSGAKLDVRMVDRSHMGTLMDIGRPRHLNAIFEIYAKVVESTLSGV